jgi:PAS domain S-box-containing protein
MQHSAHPTEVSWSPSAPSRTDERFQTIFERAAIGLLLTDSAGCIAECNPAFARMLGYREAEIVGVHFADITHRDDVSWRDARLTRASPSTSIRPRDKP